MTAEPVTFLLDNGSLEPAATLRLRELAQALAARVGEPVEPVSLLHSSVIARDRLGGVAAENFEPAVERRAEQGRREFLVVPLFFGPSRAITEYLPRRIGVLRGKFSGLAVRVAPPLFDREDPRLAQILADHVRAVSGGSPCRVALVDHGSPIRAASEVRNALVRQLSAELGRSSEVAGCCLERRPGPDHDFNGPLLAELLSHDGWNTGEVAVALQFLLPGRHAGPGGDVAEICRRAETEHPGLRACLTPLVGGHPRLPDILADRWRSGRRAPPL
ncbi:MAG: cobalamin biosynthesis protein CbiX [Opitutus sp.]|nr:cobalamin biosynthesis protein CbiX [Opitutus sp.]